ncbi:hypothetical protein P3S68_001602 [Capsicum galapagoense]
MEVWALEGFVVAHILQEILTYKSDHIRARQNVLGTMIIGGTIPNPEDAPKSFRLLIVGENSLVEWEELGEEGHTGNEWEDRKVGRRKDFFVRRVELAKHFIRTNIEPEWMVLCLLPVIPPELRPIIQIDERELVMCREKLVQEDMDTLLDNGIRGQPMRDDHNKVYKSFSDVFEGKEGRFCETLLGKRVDYSGRSIIVAVPSLSLHRCGLPREIAIELFQTFVIHGLIRQHLALNIGVAKSKIREKEPIIWEILQEVMQGHPVLMNRAPTLYRLGIHAFQPVLVEGRAICLHPLVCKGFNADFDGDQMAVHVPLSLEAQVEALLLMFSHMNLLSPAIRGPISVPMQECLLDSMYINERKSSRCIVPEFIRESRSIKGSFTITDSNPLSIPTHQNMEVLMAERANLVFHNKAIDGTAMKRLISRLIEHFGMAYTSHILDQVKTLGFQQAIAISISLGIDDLLTIPSKGWLVQDAEQQSLILEKHHHYGNVLVVEKLLQSIEIWYATSEYLRQEMNTNYRMTDPFNPVHIMSFSGARGNASQVHKLVEYIISCYGAHKGVVDTVVRTSDPGYLTRRLVEVAQHIVVRRTNCGTTRGISVSPRNGMMPKRIFSQTLIGRVLADDIYMGSRCIATRNQDIGIGLVNRFITFGNNQSLFELPLLVGVHLGFVDYVMAGVLLMATFHTGGVFTGGTAEHVRAPSNGKIKFNEDLVHPTRTRHGHPAFLCSIDLYVTIESEDILHNVNIPPKSLLLVQNDQYGPCRSSLVYLSIHMDQDQMNAHSLFGKQRYTSNLSVTNDQARQKLFSSDFYVKKEDRIPDYSDLNRIICTGQYNLVYSLILHENSNLLSKRRRNKFIIPLHLIQELENQLMPCLGISIKIPVNGIFRQNSILAYFDDPRYRRKSSGIIKYGTIETHSVIKKEDLIKYRGVKEFRIIGVDTQITLNLRNRVGGLVRVEKKNKRIELKIFSGDIHFPGETDKISRHTVRPFVTYEITDGINLETLFPPDPLQERDNVQLLIVNYILYGNGKPIRGISNTSIQLVRACLVLNWNKDKKSSSCKKARACFVEISTNGLIRHFLRINLVKFPISYIGKRNDPSGLELLSDNGSDCTNIHPFSSIYSYSKAKIQQSLNQPQGTIHTLLNRNKEYQSLIILSATNYSRMGPFKDVKYHSVIKESIKKNPLIPIRNSFGPLGTCLPIMNFYSSYHLITHNQILVTNYLQLDNLNQTFQVIKFKYYLMDENGKIFNPDPCRNINLNPFNLNWSFLHHNYCKPYLATPGATVHGHYGKTLYEGDTLVTFIYEKSRSGDITQGLPKVEQVLEVHSIDSISMNLEKRVEGWNKCITRILGIPWGFLIGAELTITQSRISLVNKIQ